MKYRIIALIPARSGSERIRDKNIIKLNGNPLIYYTIKAAIKSKIFNNIIVSTDSAEYKKISEKFGAHVPFLRPQKYAQSNSPDYQWVNFTIKKLKKIGLSYDYFFILRPTNPFRTHRTIIRAWNVFKKNLDKAESLRAVEICKQHPYKMWRFDGFSLKPLIYLKKSGQPFYNMQMKSLPTIYVQNASLEISKISNLFKYKTITGKKIIPFFTKRFEGFDINYKVDLLNAKYLMKKLTLRNISKYYGQK